VWAALSPPKALAVGGMCSLTGMSTDPADAAAAALGNQYCGTLATVNAAGRYTARILVSGRGLQPFTFQLNVSVFCGIEGAFRYCLGGGK
jgi:hypothetical protein